MPICHIFLFSAVMLQSMWKNTFEESKPLFAVGEYWDSCEYSPTDNRMRYNQGKNDAVSSQSTL
jgi:hypothetical protein